MPDASASNHSRCPECGWGDDGTTVLRADWPLHWRRVVPALIVVVVAATFAARAYVTRSTGMSGNGTPRTTILDSPPFTYADIRSIAEGADTDDNDLCRSILELIEKRAGVGREQPGDWLIDAGFFSEKLERRQSFQFGWPSPWYGRSEKARYEDAVRRTGFIPWATKHDAEMLEADLFLPGVDYMSPQKRWSWNRNQQSIAFRPPVEETGGVKVNTDFLVRNIAASIGMIVIAWAFVRVCVWLANILLRRRSKQLRLRWLSALVVLGMTLYVLTMAVQTRQLTSEVTHFEMGQQQGRVNQAVYWVKSTVTRLPIRGEQLRELARQPGGDRVVAQAIMDACKPALDSTYLGIEITPEAMLADGQHTTFGQGLLRILTLHEFRHLRRPDAGAPEYLASPAEQSVSLRNGSLTWTSSAGDANTPVVVRSINLPSLGLAMLGLTVLWLTVRMLCNLAQRVVVRRRRKRGQCVNCGYILRHPQPQLTSE